MVCYYILSRLKPPNLTIVEICPLAQAFVINVTIKNHMNLNKDSFTNLKDFFHHNFSVHFDSRNPKTPNIKILDNKRSKNL